MLAYEVRLRCRRLANAQLINKDPANAFIQIITRLRRVPSQPRNSPRNDWIIVVQVRHTNTITHRGSPSVGNNLGANSEKSGSNGARIVAVVPPTAMIWRNKGAFLEGTLEERSALCALHSRALTRRSLWIHLEGFLTLRTTTFAPPAIIRSVFATAR
jgi:hypothetical protein